MNDPEKLVDLPPHQWGSERDKPREPIFGPGWPIAAGVVAAIGATAFLVHTGWLPNYMGAAIGGAIGAGVMALNSEKG